MNLKNPPISEYIHCVIVKRLKSLEVDTVVDIGGVGKLNRFFKGGVVNANLKYGIDGSNLPYQDKSFDASVSIAVLEHVKKEDQLKFIKESIRVMKIVSIHWFPTGTVAQEIENLKHKYNCKHPSILPNIYEIKSYLESTGLRYSIEPLMTANEHLLLLATMHPNLNMPEVYDFLLSAPKEDNFYGVLVEVHE